MEEDDSQNFLFFLDFFFLCEGAIEGLHCKRVNVYSSLFFFSLFTYLYVFLYIYAFVSIYFCVYNWLFFGIHCPVDILLL